MQALTDEARHRLIETIDAYDTPTGLIYDEIFHEVHDRIERSGDAGKIDIAAITFWKRSGQGKWIGRLLQVPETEVRAATRQAFQAKTDQAALEALAVLPGFKQKEAISTALLCAYDPTEYAVLDRRALSALNTLGYGVGKSLGMTLRYLDTVRALRDDVRTIRPGTTARDLDKALYVLGKPV